MNWRGAVLATGLRLGRPDIWAAYRVLFQLEKASMSVIEAEQQRRLVQLVRHAFRYVPFYRVRLTEAGVIDRQGGVHLEQWQELPPLTKADIREHFDELQSHDRRRLWRLPYMNTSGGSTGEPVRFVQDRHSWAWNVAHKLYLKSYGGYQLGERELRLWGSERDILEGKERFLIRLRNWLYGRREINTFHLTEKDLYRTVDVLAEWRPAWVESYVQSAALLSRFIVNRDLSIHPPRALLTSAGTLYDSIRQEIEHVFQCPVLNRYGSREVGDVACSCASSPRLHINMLHHVTELLGSSQGLVGPGQTGEVHVTTLHNFSMPLLRYAIGDLATYPATSRDCQCGRSWPQLERVLGRSVGVFRTQEGALIDGEYFTHLLYHKAWCRQFQIVQKSYTNMLVRIVLDKGRKTAFDSDRQELTDAIRKVLGSDTRVTFELVSTIPPAPSGKFMYCVSEIDDKGIRADI